MIVRTITCHHAINHGAMLQAYALVKYLRSIGHDASIIDYRPDYLQGMKLLSGHPRYNRLGLGWLYALTKLRWRIHVKRRERAFDNFYEEFLPVTNHYDTIDELRTDAPKADAYIAGSDQIWNTTFRNGTDPAFYLDFGAKDTLRLSYAASFATDSLREETEGFVKSKLANFNHISVREKSALTLLHQLGYNGSQVVDPVFLLSAAEWDKIASHEGEGEDYILVYDFLRDSNIRIIAERLAKLYNCKIFSIGPSILEYCDKCLWKEGPTSFVSLVKNARCVVSNSFHGTAFSMIYGRDFFVVNRKDGLNIRMHDLLAHYKITERIISHEVEDSHLKSRINYNEVNAILQNDIKSSKTWIITHLK